jgi:UDP-N-acetylglucosamine--N-acetylmuramyl-(pentapeptide) pyrophosphoryl-undecaprenol N-acetylglucosamine transferase
MSGSSPKSGRVAVVAAGGTGGHLFPAEALARELSTRGWRIVLATDTRGAAYADNFPAEERLALDAATFRTGDPIGMIRGGLRIAAGVSQARKAFHRLRPSVVVGFGGYPSLPALLAAPGTRIPTVIHEQNAVLGRVNRYIAGSATAVACAFPTLEKASAKVKAKIHVVGNPIRPEIKALCDKPFPEPGRGPIRILVTGGSQGARLLSECTPAAVAQLPEDLRFRLHVTQQTRPDSMENARRIYGDSLVEAELSPFFRDMAGRLARSHLVIGRAGASTVCELAVVGRSSILVPLAIAMDDHQSFNAKLLVDAGAAVAISEKQFTPERLAATIMAFTEDAGALATAAAAARSVARPDAAERLADLVEGVAV